MPSQCHKKQQHHMAPSTSPSYVQEVMITPSADLRRQVLRAFIGKGVDCLCDCMLWLPNLIRGYGCCR